MFLATVGGVSAQANWWDSDYQYRQQVTIENNAGSVMESGYTVDADISDITSPLASGDDIRVVYNDVELDRLLDLDAGTVTFMTHANIATWESDSDYYVYYGNPSAGAAPADGNNVYLFYDDFSGYSGTDDPNFLGVWESFSTRGGAAIENGMLRMWSSGPNPPAWQKWVTKEDFTKNIRAEFDLKYLGVQDYYHPRAIAAFIRAEHNFDHYGQAFPNFFIGCCSGGQTLLVGDSWLSTGVYAYSDAFHTMTLSAFEDDVSLYRDGVHLGSVTASQYIRGGAFGVFAHGDSWGGDNVYFDNVKLSKYVSPEPTLSKGPEEVSTTGDANKGHGNDPDGVDEDNPGKGCENKNANGNRKRC